jgi:hypothetical protein
MQRPQKVIKSPKQRIHFLDYLLRLPLRDGKTIQFLIHSYYVLKETGEFVYQRQNVELVHTNVKNIEQYYLDMIRRYFAFSNHELDKFVEFLQQSDKSIYDYF